MKFARGEFVRFLIAGIITTIFSYVVYLASLQILTYIKSYTIAFCAGIGCSFYLNATYVFRVETDWERILRFPLVYLLQYGFGTAFLYAAVSGLGINEKVAPVLVIVCTVPVTFLLSRIVMKGSGDRSGGRTRS